MRFFGVSIFSGAFLLFLVQPLIARLLTPAFGGSASVWICCLLFFQIMLVLGYAYSHLLSRRISGARQVSIHTGVGLLALGSMAFNTIAWGHPLLAGWATRVELGRPLLPLLLALLAGVGVPFLWLSATSPLVQNWFLNANPGKNPYRLYALSNAGSLLGLLVFPFALEPGLGMQAHALLFGVAFVGMWLVMMRLGLSNRGLDASPVALESQEGPEVEDFKPALVLATSAVGTIALMALTVRLTSVMGNLPLLWVGPFALYLISFILPFEGQAWVRGRRFQTILAILFFGTLVLSPVIYWGRHMIPVWVQVGLLVFAGCTLVHSYLFSMRPAGSKLTLYYLYMAIGGALGGLFVGVASPILYNRVFEFPIAILLISVVAVPSLLSTGVRRPLAWSCGLIGCAVGSFLIVETQGQPGKYFRDFYGTYSLHRIVTQGHSRLELNNNYTVHGAMDFTEPLRPTAYYGIDSGFGRAIKAARARNPKLRIGLLGLGAGNAMLHAQEGDKVVIYEISHQVLEISGARPIGFPFVAASKAEVEIVEGDGRIRLQEDLAKGSRQFDVLLVDAFSGGSIPWHLMTTEALQLYMQHLKPDGLLVMHLTNNLPLDRVVAATALRLALTGLGIDHPSHVNTNKLGFGDQASRYVILASGAGILLDPALLGASSWTISPKDLEDEFNQYPGLRTRVRLGKRVSEGIRPWEDGHCSVFPLLFKKTTHQLMAVGG